MIHVKFVKPLYLLRFRVIKMKEKYTNVSVTEFSHLYVSSSSSSTTLCFLSVLSLSRRERSRELQLLVDTPLASILVRSISISLSIQQLVSL